MTVPSDGSASSAMDCAGECAPDTPAAAAAETGNDVGAGLVADESELPAATVTSAALAPTAGDAEADDALDTALDGGAGAFAGPLSGPPSGALTAMGVRLAKVMTAAGGLCELAPAVLLSSELVDDEYDAAPTMLCAEPLALFVPPAAAAAPARSTAELVLSGNSGSGSLSAADGEVRADGEDRAVRGPGVSMVTVTIPSALLPFPLLEVVRPPDDTVVAAAPVSVFVRTGATPAGLLPAAAAERTGEDERLDDVPAAKPTTLVLAAPALAFVGVELEPTVRMGTVEPTGIVVLDDGVTTTYASPAPAPPAPPVPPAFCDGFFPPLTLRWFPPLWWPAPRCTYLVPDTTRNRFVLFGLLSLLPSPPVRPFTEGMGLPSAPTAVPSCVACTCLA